MAVIVLMSIGWCQTTFPHKHLFCFIQMTGEQPCHWHMGSCKAAHCGTAFLSMVDEEPLSEADRLALGPQVRNETSALEAHLETRNLGFQLAGAARGARRALPSTAPTASSPPAVQQSGKWHVPPRCVTDQIQDNRKGRHQLLGSWS